MIQENYIQAQLSLAAYSFDLTPGARKYLMMKNRDGNLVPINDTTFNKYYSAEK